MGNIKHHDSDIFILVVCLLAFVEELCFHLDETVEGLVGDKGSVPTFKSSLVFCQHSYLITSYLA